MTNGRYFGTGFSGIKKRKGLLRRGTGSAYPAVVSDAFICSMSDPSETHNEHVPSFNSIVTQQRISS